MAHFVTPASRLADAKAGMEVAALCGAVISGDPQPGAAICQTCVMTQFETDDKTSVDASRARYDAGKEYGITEGRRQHASELRTLANERAAVERELRRKPRFEDLGEALKFTLDDRRQMTMRKGGIQSVRLEIGTTGQHSVFVDDLAIITDSDPELVRTHFNSIHDAVFGALTAVSASPA